MDHSFSAAVNPNSASFANRTIVMGVSRDRSGSEASKDWIRVWRDVRVGEPVGVEMLLRVGDVRDERGGR